MNRIQLGESIDREIKDLKITLQAMQKSVFFHKPALDKWSVAENAYHLVLSVRPLNLAFSLPLFVFRVLGKPRRNSMSFEELVAVYQQRLKEGARASGPFVPPLKIELSKEKLIQQLFNSYHKFSVKVRSVPENKLDRYLLPHPILGKITLREMIFFTCYHIQHHHRIVKERS